MERLYIISYDIANPKRWRVVYKIMQGYGEWLQLSVFQCRLDKMRLLRLEALLEDALKHDEDHVLFLDLGPADMVKPRVRSLGKPFEPLRREARII